jgi:hypothetical protein
VDWEANALDGNIYEPSWARGNEACPPMKGMNMDSLSKDYLGYSLIKDSNGTNRQAATTVTRDLINTIMNTAITRRVGEEDQGTTFVIPHQSEKCHLSFSPPNGNIQPECNDFSSHSLPSKGSCAEGRLLLSYSGFSCLSPQVVQPVINSDDGTASRRHPFCLTLGCRAVHSL